MIKHPKKMHAILYPNLSQNSPKNGHTTAAIIYGVVNHNPAVVSEYPYLAYKSAAEITTKFVIQI